MDFKKFRNSYMGSMEDYFKEDKKRRLKLIKDMKSGRLKQTDERLSDALTSISDKAAMNLIMVGSGLKHND